MADKPAYGRDDERDLALRGYMAFLDPPKDSAVATLVGVWLPTSPAGRLLGFVPLPHAWWLVLGLTLVAYVGATHAVKTWLVRRGWID